jgi:hypothetical protein
VAALCCRKNKNTSPVARFVISENRTIYTGEEPPNSVKYFGKADRIKQIKKASKI